MKPRVHRRGHALIHLFAVGFLGLALAPQTFSKEKDSGAKWKIKMRELETALIEITVDTSSDQKFNSPKYFSRIESASKKLASLAHDLVQKETTPPDADPSLSMFGALFASETQRAYKELKRGNRPYARSILRSVSGYCFACHTRNSTGPNFTAGAFDKAAESLNTLEKAQLWAATRQFDKALDGFESIIADSGMAKTRLLDWESSVRQGLAIAVRVKNDPERAMRIVDRVIAAPTAPYFLKEHAVQWKQSIQVWKEEHPRRPTTEEGLHAEIGRLIAQAQSMQKFPADKAADIIYLRASSVIHELLQAYPAGKHSTEAFLMAGITYEALRDLNILDLHEFYYEACIRRAPQTEISRNCFHRYEETMYEGFTGSGGTSLPDDVKAKLAELDKLSKTNTQKPN
ncbi:MAG: hypothetical protein AABZ55_09210 [Bdellovibrionota bacterium]